MAPKKAAPKASSRAKGSKKGAATTGKTGRKTLPKVGAKAAAGGKAPKVKLTTKGKQPARAFQGISAARAKPKRKYKPGSKFLAIFLAIQN